MSNPGNIHWLPSPNSIHQTPNKSNNVLKIPENNSNPTQKNRKNNTITRSVGNSYYPQHIFSNGNSNQLMILIIFLIIMSLLLSIFLFFRMAEQNGEMNKRLDYLVIPIKNEGDLNTGLPIIPIATHQFDIKRSVSINEPPMYEEGKNIQFNSKHNEVINKEKSVSWQDIFKELDYNSLFHNEAMNIHLFPKTINPNDKHNNNNILGKISHRKYNVNIKSETQSTDGYLFIDEDNQGAFPWILSKWQNFTVADFIINQNTDNIDYSNHGDDINDETHAFISKHIRFVIDPDYCLLQEATVTRANLKKTNNMDDTVNDDFSDLDNQKLLKPNSKKKYSAIKKKHSKTYPSLKCECRCNPLCYTIESQSLPEDALDIFYIGPPYSTECQCNLKPLHDPHSFIINLVQPFNGSALSSKKYYNNECKKMHSFGCSIIYISYDSVCLYSNIEET